MFILTWVLRFFSLSCIQKIVGELMNEQNVWGMISVGGMLSVLNVMVTSMCFDRLQINGKHYKIKDKSTIQQLPFKSTLGNEGMMIQQSEDQRQRENTIKLKGEKQLQKFTKGTNRDTKTKRTKRIQHVSGMMKVRRNDADADADVGTDLNEDGTMHSKPLKRIKARNSVGGKALQKRYSETRQRRSRIDLSHGDDDTDDELPPNAVAIDIEGGMRSRSRPRSRSSPRPRSRPHSRYSQRSVAAAQHDEELEDSKRTSKEKGWPNGSNNGLTSKRRSERVERKTDLRRSRYRDKDNRNKEDRRSRHGGRIELQDARIIQV